MSRPRPLRFRCPGAERLVWLALALLASGPALGQRVVYVDADAAPGGDGSSWAEAFSDLQAALAAAEAGDEVWLAEGVYRPTSDADRTATFTLRSGVALYGGFDGTELTRDERDWAAHASILSGDVGVPAESADNSYHVVTANGVDATAVLDGLTVERGRANGAAAPHDRGAGLLALGGSPTVRHARFYLNTIGLPVGGEKLGGGIYVEGGSPTVEDTEFEANGANSGGALHAAGGAPVLRRVTFRDNGGTEAVAFVDGSGGVVEDALFERQKGRGASIIESSPTFRRVTFRQNVVTQAGTDGAGVFVRGGAPRFEDCLFERLRTRYDLGGGFGGGALVEPALDDEPSRAAFIRTTFRENTANTGGGAFVRDSDALFLSCHFERNRALGGGGVYAYASAVAVLTSAFVGNRAERATSGCCGFGGGLSLDSAPGGGARMLVASTLFAGNEAQHGGAVDLAGAGAVPADLVNVTASGNAASAGGGALRLLNAGGVRLQNAVLWGNAAPAGPEVYVASGAGPTVERAIIEGGCPVGATCTGVLDADPLFVRAPSPGADETWGGDDDDYGDLRLQAGSPALDAGLTSLLPADVWDLDLDGDTEEPLPLDAAGQPRVEGTEVDLGAYEGAALAAVAVRVASVGAPLVRPEGGAFEFTVTLANPTAAPVALQAWSEVRGPVEVSPVLGPVALVLPAGATLIRRLVQQVPAQAPPGVYTYTVAVGSYGGAVVAADSFRAVKQQAAPSDRALGGAADAEGWAVSGWDDAADDGLPAGAALAVSVGPNPFGAEAAVTLTLPRPGEVAVALYDVLGRRVVVLHAGPLGAGAHAFALDGSALRPGLYVVRAEAGGAVATRAVTRLR